MAVALLGLGILVGGAGCGGNAPPPPEVQEQNVQDELKAMEEAQSAPPI